MSRTTNRMVVDEWEERILTWMVQSEIDNGHDTIDVQARRQCKHYQSDIEFAILAFSSVSRAYEEMDKLLAVVPADPPWENEVTIRSKTDSAGIPYISIIIHDV